MGVARSLPLNYQGLIDRPTPTPSPIGARLKTSGPIFPLLPRIFAREKVPEGRMRAGAPSAPVLQQSRCCPTARFARGPHPALRATLYGAFFVKWFFAGHLCLTNLQQSTLRRRKFRWRNPFGPLAGPAGCHWTASVLFLRNQSGVKGAPRRFAVYP